MSEPDPVPAFATEVDPRRTRHLPLFVAGTADPRRAPPEGGHLSITAAVPTSPAAFGDHVPLVSGPLIPDALSRACLAAKTATENKGQDVVVLDLRSVTPVFDFFVIATGASRRQVHTIVEECDAALRAVGDTRAGVEGYDASKWVVQDYGDVLVHVFDPETRVYYSLEDLWADAPKVDWKGQLEDDAAEARGELEVEPAVATEGE
jgi:ribosome-associated protein